MPVSVNGLAHSLLVPWRAGAALAGGLDRRLTGSALRAPCWPLQPEVVIFGSGRACVRPHPPCCAPDRAARIGVETMDTAAACRTYNVLVPKALGRGRPAARISA
jgi:uncharacterized protein